MIAFFLTMPMSKMMPMMDDDIEGRGRSE